MKDDLQRIETKVDKLDERMDNIEKLAAVQAKTLEINTEQLAVHIEGVKQTRELIALKEKEIEKKLEPIQKHVTLVNAFFKLGVAIGGIATFVATIVEIMKGLN